MHLEHSGDASVILQAAAYGRTAPADRSRSRGGGGHLYLSCPSAISTQRQSIIVIVPQGFMLHNKYQQLESWQHRQAMTFRSNIPNKIIMNDGTTGRSPSQVAQSTGVRLVDRQHHYHSTPINCSHYHVASLQTVSRSTHMNCNYPTRGRRLPTPVGLHRLKA